MQYKIHSWIQVQDLKLENSFKLWLYKSGPFNFKCIICTLLWFLERCALFKFLNDFLGQNNRKVVSQNYEVRISADSDAEESSSDEESNKSKNSIILLNKV